MADVRIIPATTEHAQHIADNVRPEDRAEIWAACLQKPLPAMEAGMKFGEAHTGIIDDVPVCMWGVIEESMIGNVGTPWMVASKDIDSQAKVFLRHCRAPVMEIFGRYDRLENYVDARNGRSIMWLRWLGFKIEEPEPYGILNLPFHKFHKESVHV